MLDLLSSGGLDFETFMILLFVAAVAYGIYFLYQHLNKKKN